MKEDSQLDPYDYMDCINWEYDPPSPLLFPLPPFAPALSNPSDSSKRPSFKNKYLNKIKHSVGERSTNSKAGLPPESEGSKGDKRVRNRVAAKESRDRKKMYIEIMEEETRQMEEELKETSKQLEACKLQIQKSTYANNQYIGAFANKLGHVYKKMEKLVTEEETDDRNNEISLAIDSISYRFGAAGRERKEHIKESYKHIFNLAVPSIHRYLLWAAHHHTHLFAPLPVPQDNDPQVASIRSAQEQERKITERSLQVGSGLDLTSLEDNEKWFGEMKEMLGDLSCKADRILFHQNQLQERRERLISLILRLCETKNCNERQASDLDNLFLDVRDILTPIQCANFILFIEKYAYRHELRYHERALIDDPDEPAPRKLSKLD